MGIDNFIAFVPHRNLNWNEIDLDFEKIKKNLMISKPRCCMNFSPSEPLHSINIEGTVIPHGICSNGKFLFVVTKEKILSIYLIYKGMIYRLIIKLTLPKKWEINNNTFIFCSQKWFFITVNHIAYQISINNLIYKNEINFTKSNQLGFQNINKACSNGATYSIITSDNSLKLFNADDDKFIIENKNIKLLEILNSISNEVPIITNGMFIGYLSNEDVKIVSIYFQEDPLEYVKNDCFPKDFNMNVRAVTIDTLSNVYFSVTFYDNNSKICSHPYIGAPDSNLFDLNFKKGYENDSIQFHLFKYLIPSAFSLIKLKVN